MGRQTRVSLLDLPAPAADTPSSELSSKDRSHGEIHAVAGWLVDCCRELDRLCQEALAEPDHSPVADPRVFDRIIGTLSSEASRLVNLASEPTHDDLVVIIETKQGEPIGPPLRRVWDAGLKKYRFVDVPPPLALIAATVDLQCCDFLDFGVVEFHWRQDPSDFASAF